MPLHIMEGNQNVHTTEPASDGIGWGGEGYTKKASVFCIESGDIYTLNYYAYMYVYVTVGFIFAFT